MKARTDKRRNCRGERSTGKGKKTAKSEAKVRKIIQRQEKLKQLNCKK